MNKFSHVDEKGNAVMVDVSAKKITLRTAKARGIVQFPTDILEQFSKNDFTTKKGSIIQTSVIAGIMAAKKTGELIPLCHSLPLDNCSVSIHFNDPGQLVIECTATTSSKTGVEMEALVGASVAALTVYDMCKALSHDIVIKEIKLMEKTGGKNDFKRSK